MEMLLLVIYETVGENKNWREEEPTLANWPMRMHKGRRNAIKNCCTRWTDRYNLLTLLIVS